MASVDVLLVVTGGLVSAAAVLAAHRLAPALVRRRQGVGPIAVLGAAAAALATAHPTGLVLWDTALLAGTAAVATIAAAQADRRILLAVTVAAAVAAAYGGAAGAAAGAAAGTAAASLALQARLPAVKALSGALVANVAVRAEWPAGPGGIAFWTAVVGALAVAGWARSPRGARRLAARAAVAAAVVAVAATAAMVGVALSARDRVDAGVAHARAGLAAARAGRGPEAASRLAAAAADFRRAERRLDSWIGWPARAVPAVARNIDALRVMARHGRSLADVGVDAVRHPLLDRVRLRGGTVDLEAVAAVRAPIRRARAALAEVSSDLDEIRSPLLVGPVARARDRLDRQVTTSLDTAETVADALRVVPALLGGDGPRRYFVAIQNNAESRALGGIIGNYAIVTADNGRLRLDEVGRGDDLNRTGTTPRRLVATEDYRARYDRYAPAATWQNVTMSPDGPTVGRVIEELYPQSGGDRLDGVVFVDPFALARLLRLTGPVRVPGWPAPVTADTAVPVLLHEHYLRFPQPERVAFLGDTVRAIFDRLLKVDLPGPGDLGRALGPAVEGRHLALHTTRASEQAFLRRVDLAGAFPRVEGDFLAVVTQNASASKIDWFLERSVHYDAGFDPATGSVSATAEITLTNRSPANGLPPYVIGGLGKNPTTPGASRLIVSVYSPLLLRSASLDGTRSGVDQEVEADRYVYTKFITVPPGATAVLRLELAGRVAGGSDDYRLDVRAQPTVHPDRVRVTVDAPTGWRALSPSTASFLADADRRISVGFRRA